jgi:hypothetical protein
LSVHCAGCGKKLRRKSAACIECHPEQRKRELRPDVTMQRIRGERELLRPLDRLVREVHRRMV